jgi:hypothetical protein
MSGDKRCREQFGSTPRATFIDTFGPEYVDLALELSVDRDRISTIIAFAAAKEHGVKSEGSQPPPDVRHEHRPDRGDVPSTTCRPPTRAGQWAHPRRSC